MPHVVREEWQLAFSRVDELLQALKDERTIPDRFPVRFILVDEIAAWQELLHRIKTFVDMIIKLSDLCSGRDVLPNVDDLTSLLRLDRENNILVLPMGEFLRLHEGTPSYLADLAAIEEVGTRRRIYVPIFDAAELFFLAMEKIGRFGDGESCKYYTLRSGGSKRQNVARVIIMPDTVDVSALEEDVCNGLQTYFRLWETGGKERILLKTQFAPFLKDVYGSFSLSVLKNSFEVLMHYLPSPTVLNKEDGTGNQWGELLRNLRNGETLHDVLRRVFKVMALDTALLLPGWRKYNPFQRWLLWMWCRFDLRSGYLHYVFSRNKSLSTLEEDIVNGVFQMPEMTVETELAWLRERKKTIQDLGLFNMPASFWQNANSLTDPLAMLKVLTGISHEERRKAVIAVSKMLEAGLPLEQWLVYLEIAYPELAWYLDNVLVSDDVLHRYFREYCRAKLMDTVTKDIVELARNACGNGSHYLWKMPVRKNVLDQLKPKSGKVYWVDGLGVEWMGLITGLIRNRYPDVVVDYQVTRANLPSTTAFNRGWEDDLNYLEFKGLDELIHSYTCEYPDYIIKEIETVERIVQEAVTTLTDTGSLIITADHGASRLAAIHEEESIPLPCGAVAEKLGRYCVYSDAYDVAAEYEECLPYEDKLVFATHRRFKMGGNVQGEIHGGATLEEALVPVILLRKTDAETEKVQVAFRLLTPKTKLNAHREGVVLIALHKQIEKLTMVVSGKVLQGKMAGDQWEFNIYDLGPAKYKGKLYAENQLIGELEFELQLRGLVQNDMEI